MLCQSARYPRREERIGIVKTEGIIVSIIPFSESSQICKALCRDAGNVSFIAKGIRKKTEGIHRMWEYELGLTEPKEEGLFLLKDLREMRDYDQYPSPSTWAAADCGAELLTQIIIPKSESAVYYALLKTYLDYLKTVSSGGIFLFWRLIIRLYILLGIDLDVRECTLCKVQGKMVGHAKSGDLYCASCYTGAGPQTIPFSGEAASILYALPEIANHYQDLTVTRAAAREISAFFADYYYQHYKQTLKLMSLNVLMQFLAGS